MNPTREWIMRTLTRPGLQSLDAALLTGHGLRFGMARLSFVYARALLRTAVHAAELWFMARAFSLEFAIPLFSMRALFGLSSSLWWGPLEALRRKVRQEVHDGRPGNARAAIDAWSCIAGLIGLCACGYAVWHVSQAEAMEWWYDGLYGSYLLASAVTLAVDLWSRTLHAGAFALGRVYRPRWSMVVPDLLELALIVGLWPYLRAFALGVSVLVTALLRAYLSIVYTQAAYRVRRLPWPYFMRLRSLARLDLQDLRVATRGLLGSIPAQLDRVLLMSLLAAHVAGRDVLPIAAPFYALRPVASVANGWARTYYVDLVRLDSLASTLFRVRIERLLHSVSLVAGGLAAGTLLAGGAVMFGMAGVEAAGWLVPLCFVRSHFAELQIRAIAYARTDALVALSLVMTGVALCSFKVHASDRELMALVTVLLAAIGLVAAAIQRLARKRRRLDERRVSLGAWLSILSETRQPVRLHVARVGAKLARPMAVLQHLHAVVPVRRVTRVGRVWLMWWEDARDTMSAPELAALLCGTCEQHVHFDAASGWDALNAACSADAPPREFSDALRGPRNADRASDLRKRFMHEVPEGHVIDTLHASPGLALLPHGEITQIRRALLAESHEQRVVPRRARWQVAVYAPQGEPTLVFVWPARTAGTGQLRRDMAHAGWRDSLPHALSARASEKT